MMKISEEEFEPVSFEMCGNAIAMEVDLLKFGRRLPKELHDELYGEGAYDEMYGDVEPATEAEVEAFRQSRRNWQVQ
jgi:hypothetical protein